MSATGKRTPVSLLAAMSETTAVSGASAASSVARSRRPSRSTGRRVTREPCFSRKIVWLSTAECSTAEVMTWRLAGSAERAARRAVLLLSVALPVKTI